MCVGVKSSGRQNANHDEDRNDYELHDQEWRFGLRRRQRLQEWQLLESLHDADEDIQIKSHDSADHIDQTPSAGQAKDIYRDDCDRQHQQRYDADHMWWSEG